MSEDPWWREELNERLLKSREKLRWDFREALLTMSNDKKKVCINGGFFCKLEGLTRAMKYALDVKGNNEGV